jgi:Fur family iron response transcriptional regulator
MDIESTDYRKEVTQRLQQAGVSPTQQRMEIAQILFARPQHLSAEQVLNIVNAQGPVVSKATVYNTLGLFARKGLVREVIVDPTKVFYDSNTSEHHHFYNVDTGNLTDIEPDSLKLESMPTLPDGTQAAGVDVIIRVRHSS